MKGSKWIAAADAALATRERNAERDHDGMTWVAFDHHASIWDEWLSDAVYAGHGNMMPDDYRFSFCEDALIGISEQLDADTEYDDSEVFDKIREDYEAPVYTSHLTAWLHSRCDRYSYCEDAQDEYGSEIKFLQLIGLGYIREFEETADAFISKMGEWLETQDEEVTG